MLIQHSFFYLVARGVPGVISLVALILYTRLLSAEEYGRYALALSSIGLIQILIFEWLHLVLARFKSEREGEESARILPAILAMYIFLSVILVLISFGLFLVWPNSKLNVFAVIVVACAIAQGWIEISLKLESLNLRPRVYGQILTTKNLTALAFGCILIWNGFAELAPLIGLLCGVAISWLVLGRQSWKGVVPVYPHRSDLKKYAAYGFPLTVTLVLGWVISSSDRIIISYLIDDAATGAYAAGYDLTQQSLGLLLVIVNTAAYPLVMQAITQKGEAAARTQLAINGEFIITVAIVSAAVIIGLTPSIAGVVIGAELRSAAAIVMPWIAVGAAIAGIKSFHLDVAFQLAKEPKWQAYTAALAAVTNVLLNFLMIPWMGLRGAAIATVISLLLACVLSWWVGRRVFPVPSMIRPLCRAVIVAGSAYIGALYAQFVSSDHVVTLIIGFLICATTVIVAAFLVNACGVRDMFLRKFLNY